MTDNLSDKRRWLIALLFFVFCFATAFGIGGLKTVFADSVSVSPTGVIEENMEDASGLLFGSKQQTSEVFSFVNDEGRSVLKILNTSSTSWAHDSALLKDVYSDVSVEAVLKRDASVSTRNGFPLLVLRKTDSAKTHEEEGGGIAFGVMSSGKYIIYDTCSGTPAVNVYLPSNCYTEGEYYTIKVIAEGNRYMFFVNGVYVVTYVNTNGKIAASGYLGIASSNSAVYVDSIKVTALTDKTMKVSDYNRFYDFKDNSQFSEFQSFYTSNGAVSSGSVSDHWNVNLSDGVIYMKNLDTSSSATDVSSVASLYLKDMYQSNFDISVDYKRGQTDSRFVALVGRSRAQGDAHPLCLNPSALPSQNGGFATALVQGSGRWSLQMSGRLLLYGEPMQGYNDNSWHNLRLVCKGMIYEIYFDYELVCTYHGSTVDALAGFMGLQARNNGGLFKNLSVTTLDVYGNPVSIAAKNDKIKVATVGDSITYGSSALDSDGNWESLYSYPARLAAKLGDEYEVRNFGFSGKRMRSGNDCYRSFREYQEALAYAPDIVYIMLGTNDGQTQYWDYNVGAAEYETEYKNMIAAFRAANPSVEVIVMASPYIYRTDTLFISDFESQIIALERKIAADTDCFLIDIYNLTKPDGHTDKTVYYHTDLLHPNKDGYELIASYVYDQTVSYLTAGLSCDYSDSQTVFIGNAVSVSSRLCVNGRGVTDTGVFYAVEDGNIASVSNLGTVVGISVGTTRIIVTKGGFEPLYITVTVKAPYHTDENKDGLCDLCGERVDYISEATLSVGKTMTLNYYAVLTKEQENAVMRFTFKDRVYYVEHDAGEIDGKWVYRFTGISPHSLGVNLKSELIGLDDEILDEKAEYSVRTYCKNMLKNIDEIWPFVYDVSDSGDSIALPEDFLGEYNKYAKLRVLISDLINYGGEAQKFAGVYLDDVVSLDESLTKYASNFNVDRVESDYYAEASKDKNCMIISAGVILANDNRIYFNVYAKDKENKTVNVYKRTGYARELYGQYDLSDIETAGNVYGIVTDGLLATENGVVFEVELSDGENLLQTVKYSVNSYVKRMYRDETAGDIVKALYKYGNSALEYMTAE